MLVRRIEYVGFMVVNLEVFILFYEEVVGL